MDQYWCKIPIFMREKSLQSTVDNTQKYSFIMVKSAWKVPEGKNYTANKTMTSTILHFLKCISNI